MNSRVWDADILEGEVKKEKEKKIGMTEQGGNYSGTSIFPDIVEWG